MARRGCRGMLIRNADKQDARDMLAWLNALLHPERFEYVVMPEPKKTGEDFMAWCVDYPMQQPVFGATQLEALKYAVESVRLIVSHDLKSWIKGLEEQLGEPSPERPSNDAIVPGSVLARERARVRRNEYWDEFHRLVGKGG